MCTDAEQSGQVKAIQGCKAALAWAAYDCGTCERFNRQDCRGKDRTIVVQVVTAVAALGAIAVTAAYF